MNLEQLQQTFMAAITQPLTATDTMRARAADGRSMAKIADEMIKPSARQTAFERLELYNTGYWFRLLGCLGEDFPGLRAVVGSERFEALAAAYLHACPPGFDLDELGARLNGWLRRNPGFAPRRERLALDMAELEWAEIEASGAVQLPNLTADDIGRLGQDCRLTLQPHVRLLDLAYPVDDLLLAVRSLSKEHSAIVGKERQGRAARKPLKRCSMPRRQRIFLAVHQREAAVFFKRLEPEAFALLVALRHGQNLSDAIEAAVEVSEDSFRRTSAQVRTWFGHWSSLGWFASNT
jgi:hypothetical protein